MSTIPTIAHTKPQYILRQTFVTVFFLIKYQSGYLNIFPKDACETNKTCNNVFSHNLLIKKRVFFKIFKMPPKLQGLFQH